jgi:hypothetical protein
MQASTTNAEEPKKGPQQTKIAALFLCEGAMSEAVIIQDLRIYLVALQTHSDYNESVNQRSFPAAFGFLYR